MVRMAKQGTNYELFVRDICQVLLEADGLDTVTAQHDVTLTGRSGAEHQIDVYWEFRRAGVNHRVVIECKEYHRAVSIGVVRSLIGLMDDVPGLQGMVVTTKGFQSGAVELARSRGIGLRVIRPPQDQDWEGRIRTVELSMTIIQPEVLNFRLDLDKSWASQNLSAEQNENLSRSQGLIQLTASSPNWFVDHDTGATPVHLLVHANELVQALPLHNLQPGEATEHVFAYENAFVTVPDLPPIKISKFTIEYRRHESATERVKVESTVRAIVKDAIDGRLQFIDQEGRISGDTD